MRTHFIFPRQYMLVENKKKFLIFEKSAMFGINMINVM